MTVLNLTDEQAQVIRAALDLATISDTRQRTGLALMEVMEARGGIRMQMDAIPTE